MYQNWVFTFIIIAQVNRAWIPRMRFSACLDTFSKAILAPKPRFHKRHPNTQFFFISYFESKIAFGSQKLFSQNKRQRLLSFSFSLFLSRLFSASPQLLSQLCPAFILLEALRIISEQARQPSFSSFLSEQARCLVLSRLHQH